MKKDGCKLFIAFLRFRPATKHIWVGILGGIVFLTACQNAPLDVQPAFYHWQTNLKIDTTAATYLQQLSVKRLYTKFFDVTWDHDKQQAVPVAVLQLHETAESITSLDIIPTIFITNSTFQESSPAKLGELANRIWAKIQAIMPNTHFEEIQFDCDWTLRTRDAYFQFLTLCRQRIPKTTTLSATIRLHQYRYPEKTGIPPVGRGMLMFYNMGDLQDWQEDNSILNLEKAAPYLQKSTYPLTLDFALPLFRWAVLFREGKMIKLINGLDEHKLTDTSFFESLAIADTITGTHRYRLKKSTYLDGYYLYKGDLLRLEWISAENLKKATALLRSSVHSNTIWLSFYHLDTPLLEAYDYDVLQECLDILSSPD